MRSNPRVPELLEYVEFGRDALELKHVRGEADLVVVGRIRNAHRLLVERREAHRLGLAIGDHAERVAVVGEYRFAARLAGDTSLDSGGIQMLQIFELDIRILCAGNSRAFVEDSPIPDHDDA